MSLLAFDAMIQNEIAKLMWTEWVKKFAWRPTRVSGQWLWFKDYYERQHYLTCNVERGTIFDVLTNGNKNA